MRVVDVEIVHDLWDYAAPTTAQWRPAETTYTWIDDLSCSGNATRTALDYHHASSISVGRDGAMYVALRNLNVVFCLGAGTRCLFASLRFLRERCELREVLWRCGTRRLSFESSFSRTRPFQRSASRSRRHNGMTVGRVRAPGVAPEHRDVVPSLVQLGAGCVGASSCRSLAIIRLSAVCCELVEVVPNA